MVANRIFELEKMLGVKHSEWFTVEREGMRYECRFYAYGLSVKQEDNNPYVRVDIGPYLLQDLIVGQAVIINGRE